MARYPIYASDFGQLGNQLQQEQAMQQRAIEMSAARLAEAQARQQQQANFDRQMAYRQAMDQEALRRQAMIDAQNERYMNWQMSPAGRAATMPAANRTYLLKQAAADAEEGLFESPQDVSGKYPSLMGDEATAIASRSKQRRPELAQQQELLTGAADTLNRRNALRLALRRLDEDIAGEPKRQSILYGDFMRKGTSDITKRLRTLRDKYAKELAAIEPQVRMIEQDETFAGALQFDPGSRSFRPAYIPEFMNTNKPTATATNAPVRAAVNQTRTANPYKVGARYGDLRYVGGDPNLETSWTPVQ